METEHENRFEADPKLGQDLKRLYDFGSPPENLDRRVLDRARVFVTQQRRMRLVRKIGSAAAVAAILIIGFTLTHTEPPHTPTMSVMLASVAQDIDRNGRVDIRDALKLARRIETAEPIRPEWDLNHDGAVDQADVDAVAYAAVRLKQEGVL
ncbi:MAG: hypothetical protein JXA82_02355 [Sedimentisphaerales bacterium]|nr:hypothetical protein [Sedimentisphaerales bacterium]